MPLCASVYLCLVVTCWERADFLALACGVKLCLCHIPFGILGQVWYLIVSIPDLCSLTYSEDNVSRSSEKNLNGIINLSCIGASRKRGINLRVSSTRDNTKRKGEDNERLLRKLK